MLLGTAFLAAAAFLRPGVRKAALLGLLAGLMHLARADGVIWLGVGLAAAGLGCLEGQGRGAGGRHWRRPLAPCCWPMRS